MCRVLSALASSGSDSSSLGSSRAAKSSLKMSVVDAGDFSKIENWSMDPDKFSNRVSSLTNESCQFLKGKERKQSTTIMSLADLLV